MSKLYGPDEGYEVVQNRSSKKKNANKPERKVASLYSKVRGKISDLICDQEPVLHGPPFNPVVDLDSLSHGDFVTRARRVITELNPEGHPPPGVSSPTMMNLIDRLEISKNEGRSSYASVLQNGSPRSSPSSSPVKKKKTIQQVACPTPCRYVHYKDIVQDTSKKVVLQRFQGVAPKLSLTEATIALMTKKINSDSKFK